MNQRDLAAIQGMLDARLNRSIGIDDHVICPFVDDGTEDELRNAWYEGFNFHLEPKIISG